jgi:hypothetical protein
MTSTRYVFVMGTGIVVVMVFSAVLVVVGPLVVPRWSWRRRTMGTGWGEKWVMVVSIERVVVVDEMEMVRKLGRRVRFRGCIGEIRLLELVG